jgi:membrane-associated phospholipid phosphatase
MYDILIQNYYLIVFFLGALISSIVNRLLKDTWKGKRPDHPIKFLASEHFVKKGAPYGMPSGHTQFLFFCIAYLFLACTSCSKWVYLSFVIALVAVYERYVFHNHTMTQLVVGSVLGLVLGIAAYEMGVYGFRFLE